MARSAWTFGGVALPFSLGRRNLLARRGKAHVVTDVILAEIVEHHTKPVANHIENPLGPADRPLHKSGIKKEVSVIQHKAETRTWRERSDHLKWIGSKNKGIAGPLPYLGVRLQDTLP